MRRYLLLLCFMLIIMLLPSCKEQAAVWEPEIDDYMSMYIGDSTGTPDARGGMSSVIYGEDDFVCYAEYASYSLDFKQIDITLKSVKGETGFVYCTTPALEYLNNGQWQRLEYLSYSKTTGSYWPDAGSAFSDEVKVCIYKGDVYSTLRPGRYRAIVFVGGAPTKFYAEFDITAE